MDDLDQVCVGAELSGVDGSDQSENSHIQASVAWHMLI